MPENDYFHGGFERSYENGTHVTVAGNDTGFIVIEHSALDKPLKIHTSTILDLADQSEEMERSYYL